jgi:hypothetical protein
MGLEKNARGMPIGILLLPYIMKKGGEDHSKLQNFMEKEANSIFLTVSNPACLHYIGGNELHNARYY